MTRTKCKSKMPASTEDYRRVMRVEANACMAARYRAKPWLHGLVAADFTKFVDYILGDRVYGIQLPSSTTEFAQRVKPDWSIVLAYEFKLRREVMKLITQHARTMSEALTMVTRDANEPTKARTSRAQSLRHSLFDFILSKHVHKEFLANIAVWLHRGSAN